jgi:hypothetical protein
MPENHVTGHRRAGRVLSVGGLLVSLVWACDSAPPPTSPSQMQTAPPPVATIVLEPAHVSGHVFDADTGSPVAGAALEIVTVHVPGAYLTYTGGSVARSDERGAFVVEATLPEDWKDVAINVRRDGFEAVTGQYVTRAGSRAAELRIYPTIEIRPGEALDLSLSLGHYACGEESYTCRRIALTAPPGASVRVAAVPAPDGPQGVGLWTTNIFRDLPLPEREMTLGRNAVEFWVLGELGAKLRLSASLAD